MNGETRTAILACSVLMLCTAIFFALVWEELKKARVIIVRADHDLSPAEISELIEEAKRITGESK
jgi:hypothetical protein